MRAKALSAPSAEFLLERPSPAMNLLPSGEDAATSSAMPAADQDVQPLEPIAEAHLTAPAGKLLMPGSFSERADWYGVQNCQ